MENAATLSFSVFQCLDLQDSLSAQVASILLLFPMHWNGSRFAGRTRAHGTLLGCVIALLIMLLLYDHHDLLPLVALLLWIAAMVCARWHMLEKGVPGVGFGALTTLAILFGQSLTPSHDIIFATLYRLSSVCLGAVDPVRRVHGAPLAQPLCHYSPQQPLKPTAAATAIVRSARVFPARTQSRRPRTATICYHACNTFAARRAWPWIRAFYDHLGEMMRTRVNRRIHLLRRPRNIRRDKADQMAQQ